MFQNATNSVIMLLICMAVGYVCYRRKLIDDHTTSGLSAILINVSLPCLLFSSLQKPFSLKLLAEGGLSALIMSGVFLSGLVFAYILVKLLKPSKKDSAIWYFIMVFPNCAFMGVPVISLIFGEEAIFYVSGALLSFNLLCFTLGVKLINIGNDQAQKLSIIKALKSPAIISIFIGLIFFLFSIKLPNAIDGAINLIGNVTTPLSMIIVGAVLAKERFSEVFTDKSLYILTFFRLLVIPVIIYFITSNFITDEKMLGTICILSSMPAATTTAIFAKLYDADIFLASKAVFITTLLSMVTIPVVSLLL